MADAQTVLYELVRARSSSLLDTAYLLTADRAAAERLLHDALLAVRRHHGRVDPFEVEHQVRSAMARIASAGGRAARRRTVVALSLHEGLTTHEIAHLLECSAGRVASDLARGEAARLRIPDELAPTDEWRADVTDELDGTRPIPLDRQVLVALALTTTLLVAVFAAVFSGVDDSSSERPLITFHGNAYLLDQMPDGRAPEVDVLDSQGMLHTPAGQVVPVGTYAAVLGRSADGWVVTPDRGGFEAVRADGTRFTFATSADAAGALSPDGTQLLTTGGTFDTSTGRRLTGPPPGLDRSATFVGWGQAGAVAVAPDGTAYVVTGGERVTALSATPYAVARDSDRVLIHSTDDCDAVAALDPSGELTRVRSWCGAEMRSLSPDGQVVLIGEHRTSGWLVRGLLDVTSGHFTVLEELNGLDQHQGEDMVGLAWEPSGSVLLAYVVDRTEPGQGGTPWQRARIVRCGTDVPPCELIPGVRAPPRAAAHTMFSESAASASR